MLQIFAALGQLVTKFSETVTQLSGPAGIYQITAQVTETWANCLCIKFISFIICQYWNF